MEEFPPNDLITSVLASGISLLLTDLVVDLRYIFAAQHNVAKRRQQALEYYLFILRPRAKPYLWPGWFFAAACSFYLLFVHPTIYHYAMALAYAPVSGRYLKMLRGHCPIETFQGWHWIVVIRCVLLWLGIVSLQLHFYHPHADHQHHSQQWTSDTCVSHPTISFTENVFLLQNNGTVHTEL